QTGNLIKKITLEALPDNSPTSPHLAPGNTIFTSSGLGMFDVIHRVGFDKGRMLIDSKKNDSIYYHVPQYPSYGTGLDQYSARQLTDNKSKIIGYDMKMRKLAIFDGSQHDFIQFIDSPVPSTSYPSLSTNKTNNQVM